VRRAKSGSKGGEISHMKSREQENYIFLNPKGFRDLCRGKSLSNNNIAQYGQISVGTVKNIKTGKHKIRPETFRNLGILLGWEGLLEIVEEGLHLAQAVCVEEEQVRIRKEQSEPIMWNLPPLNPFFTGKSETLGRLDELLQEKGQVAISQPQAIYGLGGMGKTQTALQYTYLHRKNYEAIFWVESEGEQELQFNYASIAQPLKLKERNEKKIQSVVKAVREWLTKNQNWLIIFDGANTPEFIRSLIPRYSKGHIIITSRSNRFDYLGVLTPIELTEMSEEEAVEFLAKRIRRTDISESEKEAARELANQLGYLPLALEQAGAFIATKQILFQDFLLHYRKRQIRVFDSSIPTTDNYPASVAETWKMNYEEAIKEGDAVEGIMNISAFLSPDSIPFELIRVGAEYFSLDLNQELQEEGNDPIVIHSYLEPLVRYSLIRLNPDSRTFSIHPLVQEVFKDRLNEVENYEWIYKAIRVLNNAFPEVYFRFWPTCNRLLAHALSVLNQNGGDIPKVGEITSLVNKVGHYLFERNQLDEAEKWLRKGLEIEKEAGREKHHNCATILDKIAAIQFMKKDYDEVEKLFLESMEIRKISMGENSRDYALSLNNLGGLYLHIDQLKKAEDYLSHSLALKRGFLEKNHPEIGSSLVNLGGVLSKNGKVKESEKCLAESIFIFGECEGARSPSVGIAKISMALVKEKLNLHEEAEINFKDSISIFKKELPPNHPNLLTAVRNYVRFLREHDRWRRASKRGPERACKRGPFCVKE
jgi:tetratricopeptide (TPR) repeat protein